MQEMKLCRNTRGEEGGFKCSHPNAIEVNRLLRKGRIDETYRIELPSEASRFEAVDTVEQGGKPDGTYWVQCKQKYRESDKLPQVPVCTEYTQEKGILDIVLGFFTKRSG